MPAKLSVCQNASCASCGATTLIRDLEELALGRCEVEECGCLGRCGRGPNVEVQSKGRSRIVEGVTSFKRALALVEEQAGCEVSDINRKVGRLKYDARRETDPGKKSEKLQAAFDLLGAGATSEPALLSSLLVLRSRLLLKEHLNNALDDARQAVKLVPTWAQAQLALANALEASKCPAEGAQALSVVLECGKGINKAAVKRQLTRLQRSAVEMAQTHSEAKLPKPKPRAKAGCSGKTVPGLLEATAAKSAATDADSKSLQRQVEPDLTAAPVEEVAEEEAGALEWCIDSVTRMNHDCLRIVLRADASAALLRHPAVGDVWHVDVIRELDYGEEVQRAYTPVSSAQEYMQGILELMVKVYPDGKMSSWLASLRPGCRLLVSPPQPTLDITGYSGLLMISGGSSVTVALQICRAMLNEHPQGATVQLVLCNRTAADVLYQDVFDGLLQKHPDFNLVHCISEGPVPVMCGGRAVWQQGRICAATIARAEPHLRGVVSGPMGLCQAVVHAWEQLGWAAERLSVLDELPPPQLEDSSAPSAAGAVGLGAAHSPPTLEATPLRPTPVQPDAGAPRAGLGGKRWCIALPQPFFLIGCRCQEALRDDGDDDAGEGW